MHSLLADPPGSHARLQLAGPARLSTAVGRLRGILPRGKLEKETIADGPERKAEAGRRPEACLREGFYRSPFHQRDSRAEALRNRREEPAGALPPQPPFQVCWFPRPLRRRAGRAVHSGNCSTAERR